MGPYGTGAFSISKGNWIISAENLRTATWSSSTLFKRCTTRGVNAPIPAPIIPTTIIATTTTIILKRYGYGACTNILYSARNGRAETINKIKPWITQREPERITRATRF
ncbi:MAG: hypothetical protein QGD96_10790, partial [Anaerolineae bacterium]|nr:hypothetical protein [Anaerolineae bacterium]